MYVFITVKVTQSLIDRVTLQNLLDELLCDKALNLSTEALKVLNAFDFPKLKYNITRKTFEVGTEARNLHSSAKSKAELFRSRWHLLNQRRIRRGIENIKVST